MQFAKVNDRHPSALFCRSAAFALFVCAGAVGMQAQQSQAAPVLTASASEPALFSFSTAAKPALSTDVAYSSSAGADETAAAENFIPSASSEMQPPPRRRYGRPRYADSSHNADGSNKWGGEIGVGLTLPIGNTLKYNTDSYAFGGGIGRNFNKNVSVIAQFDWDNFGLEGSTLANQLALYNDFCPAAQANLGNCAAPTTLDGNTHVWSFSVNPTYTLSTQGGIGAYFVVGVGFYHKVTTFSTPSEQCSYYYGCYVYNAAYDHYTSNAPGFSGGLGLTYKFSRFANERFFIEGRYVFVDNSKRTGYTSANVATTSYNGYDAYPANSNRTGYVPVKVGIRF